MKALFPQKNASADSLLFKATGTPVGVLPVVSGKQVPSPDLTVPKTPFTHLHFSMQRLILVSATGSPKHLLPQRERRSSLVFLSCVPSYSANAMSLVSNNQLQLAQLSVLNSPQLHP